MTRNIFGGHPFTQKIIISFIFVQPFSLDGMKKGWGWLCIIDRQVSAAQISPLSSPRSIVEMCKTFSYDMEDKMKKRMVMVMYN